MKGAVGATSSPHRPPARRRRADVPSGRADLHVHSLWSDGAQRPETIVKAAAGRVDVLAITDHDEVRGAPAARDFALEHPEVGVDVVVGEEISTRNGHLIGLWLTERVAPGLSAIETIARIHDQGGLAVADDLRAALVAGATRAQVHWSWTAAKLPRHLRIQLAATLRFRRHHRRPWEASHLTGRAT